MSSYLRHWILLSFIMVSFGTTSKILYIGSNPHVIHIRTIRELDYLHLEDLAVALDMQILSKNSAEWNGEWLGSPFSIRFAPDPMLLTQGYTLALDIQWDDQGIPYARFDFLTNALPIIMGVEPRYDAPSRTYFVPLFSPLLIEGSWKTKNNVWQFICQIPQGVELFVNDQSNRFNISVNAPRLSWSIEPPGASWPLITQPPTRIVGKQYDVYLENSLYFLRKFKKGKSTIFEFADKKGFVPDGLQTNRNITTICIDPGHGGYDVGTTGKQLKTREKDLTLLYATRLKNLLESYKFKVVLTRSMDIAVNIEERTEIANKAKADLFISLHFNSLPHGIARGTETWVLSQGEVDEAAKILADRENQTSGTSSTNKADPLRLIMWDLAQIDYLRHSAELAQILQNSFSLSTNTRNRGVKQAPFVVLKGATMPAVLIELGFLSDSKEEAALTQEVYAKKLVEALARGILQFTKNTVVLNDNKTKGSLNGRYN